MAQISKGDTFVDGQQVTGARLNQLVDSSVLLVGAITDQPSITANTLQSTDSTIVNDAGVLKEATIGDFLNSNLPITASSVTTSSITGGAGVDIVITPAAGQKMDVGGAFEANSLNVTGNSTIGGNETVTGNLLVTGTTTLTGNATASGNLSVTGNLTAGGNPVQQRVDTAVITLSLPTGTQYIYTTVGAWTNIPLNAISQNNSFVVNSASFTGTGTSHSDITLPAGTYQVQASVMIQSQGGSGGIVPRIRNATSGAVIAQGFVAHCGGFSNSASTCYAIFTLAVQSTINIQYWLSVGASATYSTTQIGLTGSASETLFPVVITKLA